MPLSSPNLCSVGLDIGGTNIKFIVLDSNLRTVVRGSRPSQAKSSVGEVVKTARNIILELEEQGHQFDRIGVGCAGSVDPKAGLVRTSPNFHGWKDVPLASLLAHETSKACVVENDGNCAAWGEWVLGASRKVEHLMVLTLGTGIGGGLVIRNRIFRGATSTGPELGHFSINFDGPVCSCGNLGCFEYYCSGSAFRRGNGISARDFFAQVDADPKLQTFLASYVQRLSVGLASLANLFDPQLILLAGGVASGLKPSLGHIQKMAKELCFPSIAAALQIGISDLDEFSGAMGAATLNRESLVN